MAINAYTGLMGSGKSYEVVSGPVCTAIAAGRRVVTNVAGINESKIHAYLVKKNPELDPDKLGTVVHVRDEEVMTPTFFPDEEHPEMVSIVKPGDLVAIDEAWRFWEGKLPHLHMQFFRMHRHYVHPETGVTCDVALMTQDVMGLSRQLRSVIEATFRMHKLKSIGSSKSYRVEMYEGCKQTAKARTAIFIRRYDKEVFPLYKSYDNENAKEVQVDKRQNVLRNPRVIMTALLVVILFVAGLYNTVKFFTPPAPKEAKAPAGGAGHKDAAATGQGGAVSSPARSSTSEQFSSEWRIAGQYEAQGDRYVVVADQHGRLRVESPSQFRGAGIAMVGKIDDARVTYWSGSGASGGVLGSAK